MCIYIPPSLPPSLTPSPLTPSPPHSLPPPFVPPLQRPGATDALHALAEQRERLEEELVRSHGDCMRLRLDCEQAALEVPRLKVGRCTG